MKITNVKTILTSPNQNYLFVKITTDSGIYGVGDASLNGREQAVADLIDEYLTPMLIGRDPGKIEDFWQLIYRGSYWRGGNIVMSALCGIDMALWDILGKECGKPLYALLGGKVRDKVLCYSHVLGKTQEEKIAQAADYVKARGLKVIRLRAGLPAANGTFGLKEDQNGPVTEPWNPEEEWERTLEYFVKVREAVGYDVGIIYDLHERFSPDRAIRLINALEPYRPFFIEDPIAPDCLDSLRYVREKTTSPIAFGELYKSRWECLPAITNHWIDYIRCDIIRIGGITEARKIAALAETYDVKTAWHGPNDVSPITHAVNWHLNVSSYNFGIQEDGTTDGLIREVIRGGISYRDGYLYLKDAPGIGCDIDEETAARYPFHKAYLPICRQDDGALHTW
ncbi:MAG: D-galactonate dehydratase family protein [Clostridiales bacterium]|nr:D-galactonate dehydratase family protein [Clostridiales bacterium]